MEESTNSPSGSGKHSRKNSRDSNQPPKIEELTISADEVSDSPEELNQENRQGLLKILGQAIGFDITTISLPVNLNEPVSFLTRLCEGVQYSDLLDKAAECDSSIQRLLYVSLFATSIYTCAERGGKPFNPLLGETYELVDEKRNNLKFIAEQVSHHPPVGACHAETDTWKFWQSQQLKTKFAGNSLDCSVVGTSNVYLKETKEHFKWSSVKTSVHNVIFGKVWLDHYGEPEIVNKSTGEVAKIKMKQCGWFSSGWHEIEGDIIDSKGQVCISIFGKWNDAIYGRLRVPSSAPESPDVRSERPSTPQQGLSKKEEKKLEKQLKKEEKQLKKDAKKEMKKDKKDFKKMVKKKLTSNEPLWVHTIKPLEPSKLPVGGGKYMVDWTAHTLYLSELTDSMVGILPPSDSRLRLDRLALEKGDVKKAGNEKYILEEKQREDKRKRESSGKAYTPKYFKLSKDEDGEDYWEFQGGYWEEREQRVQQLKEKN